LRAALDLAAKPETAPRARAIAEAFGIERMVDRVLAVQERVRAMRARA